MARLRNLGMIETAQHRRAVQQRRSERLRIAFPVEVFGVELHGRSFVDSTRTESVSRDGAGIRLHHQLAPGQQLKIRRTGMPTEIEARVVRLIACDSNGRLYAVELINCPETRFWGIHFPPLSSSEKISGVELSCSVCGKRELVRLSAVESAALDERNGILRTCSECNDLTVWQPELGQPDSAAGQGLEEPVQNRRKHPRVRMTVSGYLRLPQTPAGDSVKVVDLSRGGVRFLSTRLYGIGAEVQVAVPYTHGTENLFLPARIVWRAIEESIREYGLAYIPAGQAQRK